MRFSIYITMLSLVYLHILTIGMYSEVRIPHINENRGVYMFKKVELQEGVTLYIRKSDQFKTVNFSVKWKTALDEKKSAATCSTRKCFTRSNGRYRTQTDFEMR